MHDQSDSVTGVSAFEYGKVEAVDSESSDALDALTTCDQYAVVAFWGLHPETDCIKCYRFFFAPNPYKRMIRNSEKAELSQVLYYSPHTNDVFLYFEGYHASSPRTLIMQCAILDLRSEVHHQNIKDHCESTYTIN